MVVVCFRRSLHRRCQHAAPLTSLSHPFPSRAGPFLRPSLPFVSLLQALSPFSLSTGAPAAKPNSPSLARHSAVRVCHWLTMMAAPGYITPAAGSAPVFRDPFARKRKRARPLQDQGLLPQLRKAANSLGIHLLDDKASCHQPLDEHRNEDYQYDDDQYSPHQQHFPVVDPSSSSTYTYADSIYRKDSSTDGSRP